MALKKYIGARYAPKFMGAWDKESQYAALSVVYYNDQSFVSRKTVPANTEILNTEFWIKSADWNAQVTQYNRNVEEYNQNVEKYNQNVEAYQQAVSTFYADTLHSYDTKADMVADQNLALGDTVLTCGDKTIGDTGGSFYQVVAETSAKAVALANGLYALPFEFQPYDYAEFAEKTDQYKQETDEQITQITKTTNEQITQITEATNKAIAKANEDAMNAIDQVNKDAQAKIDSANKSANEQRTALITVSLRNYDNENSMKADTTLADGNTVLTSGTNSVGDGGGKFYKVKNSSSDASAVALNNGKKAVPFILEPYSIVPTSFITYNCDIDTGNVPQILTPASAESLYRSNALNFFFARATITAAKTYSLVLYRGPNPSAAIGTLQITNNSGSAITITTGSGKTIRTVANGTYERISYIGFCGSNGVSQNYWASV